MIPAATASFGSSVIPSPPATICTKRIQAGRGEAILIAPVPGEQTAYGQRLIAQAVPVLQQQQPLRRQGGDRDLFLIGQPVIRRQRDQERIPRNGHRIRAAAIAGRGQQQQIEAVGGQPIDQVRRRVLPQIQPQARKGAAQARASAWAAGTARWSG